LEDTSHFIVEVIPDEKDLIKEDEKKSKNVFINTANASD
jgi:hypothetical protein